MAKLSDILLGFGTGALEEAATQRGERRKAQVEAEAKLAIDPEAIAKFRLLNLARQAGQVSQPAGGYNLPEQQAGMPAAVAGAAQEQEMNVLRHLLPRVSSGINVFAFDPSTGTVVPATGGAALPPGSRVLPTRMSPEEAGSLAGARKKASTEAQEQVEFKSVKAAFNTAGSLLQNIPAPETQVGGFSLSQARNQLTKLGFDQDLNEYNAYVKAIAGQLAKVVSREGGRLTDQDIARVSSILEQLPFLPEAGRIKRFKTLNTVLTNKGFEPVFPSAGVLESENERTPEQDAAYQRLKVKHAR